MLTTLATFLYLFYIYYPCKHIFQIKEKIEQNLNEQRKILEHRESILAEVEASNLELKKEKEHLELLKKKYRCDISNQVSIFFLSKL